MNLPKNKFNKKNNKLHKFKDHKQLIINNKKNYLNRNQHLMTLKMDMIANLLFKSQ